MNRIGQLIKKLIHPFLIVCILLIIIAGIFIIYNGRQSYATETWVYEYLKAYDDNLTELDIQVLTQNLSSQIDEKIDEIDFNSELSREQLMRLMAMVNEELQYADFSIPQEEITKISSDIVKRIVSENISDFYATSHKTDEAFEAIEELESQLLEIRTTINNLNSNESGSSAQLIKEIAQEAGLDEATVKGWIKELHSLSMNSYDSAIQELAELLNVNAATLKNLIDDAEARNETLESIVKQLGITEDKFNSALEKLSNSDKQELLELASKLNAAEAELRNQITNNTSLITDSITSVQQQVINNQNVTNETILANKQETLSVIEDNKQEALSAIADNKQETLSAVAANKQETDEQIKNTDAALKELKNNVLFYDYDEMTNTLKLFESQ